MVFQAMVLYPRRDSGGGGAFCNSFLFQRRLRSTSAGQPFDLNKLEQMESASVILDRNGKIFGQIYVENRETVLTRSWLRI
jgi:hypothetical protein